MCKQLAINHCCCDSKDFIMHFCVVCVWKNPNENNWRAEFINTFQLCQENFGLGQLLSRSNGHKCDNSLVVHDAWSYLQIGHFKILGHVFWGPRFQFQLTSRSNVVQDVPVTKRTNGQIAKIKASKNSTKGDVSTVVFTAKNEADSTQNSIVVQLIVT